jgi:PAS domain S-box-containing protein
MRDISDRKQAEASLRQSYNLLEAVINSSPDCIFVKDLEGRYQLMNAPGANLFNKSVEELIGQDDSALFPPEIAANFRESDRIPPA